MTKARNLSDLLDANGIVDNAKITLDANEIPNLDASKIVSGDIASARLSLATETKPVVSSVSPTVITNDATNITITGTDFTAIPRVDIINTATGIWYSANTVTHNSSTSLTVNVTLAVDAGTYRIRVENPDGLAGLSGANFLTVSDAPTWSTGAGSLGTVAGNTSGTIATVSASGDTIVYSETTNVLTNASLANCSLNSSTGAITSTDFDGSSTSERTHTFTIRATDAQGQTSDREFTLTSGYSYSTDFLVIAGGGGVGSAAAVHTASGGGGAGGYRSSWNNETSGGGGSSESALTFLNGTVYTITVGNGGTGGASNFASGSNGQDSSISGTGLTTLTSLGGGYGGHGTGSGGNGGSGGGDGSYMGGSYGTGTANQGFNGATGQNTQDSSTRGGGGGGAGAAASGVNGGAGLASTITGSSVTRGGGGASVYGSGGAGGGASGVHEANGLNGTANTGGGGGGSYTNSDRAGGAGGSGVVILRMPTSKYSGTTSGSPTVSTVGSDTVLIFNASGTYTA